MKHAEPKPIVLPLFGKIGALKKGTEVGIKVTFLIIIFAHDGFTFFFDK